MSGVRQEFQSNPFVGVRFTLLGFDPQKHTEVRSKLVNGGGVDGSRVDCTHVIVDKLVYDDPVCAAARSEGKIVVTSLWVDHSLDVGMQVDALSVMYKPVRDLNGIPGANDLIVCLTGYQRQDRDDIMKMVSLMGAQFSKPLVANKVTHLICYKFEGEKYELAKRMKRITLINHRWLEDCLKAWEILPEKNYSKSGYELEMEAQANDSEEETETLDGTTAGGRNANASPSFLDEKPGNHDTHVIGGMVPNTASVGLVNIGHRKGVASIIKEEIISDRATLSNYGKQMDQLAARNEDAGGVCDAKSANQSDHPVIVPSSNKVGTDMQSIPGSTKGLADDAANFSSLDYSTKAPRVTLQPVEGSADRICPFRGNLVEDRNHDGLQISEVNLENKKSSVCVEDLHNEVGSNGSLHQKRKMDVHLGDSPPSSKSQKLNASDGKRTEATETKIPRSGISKSLSLDHLGGPITGTTVTMHSGQKAPVSAPKNSHLNERLLETNLHISKSLTSEMIEGNNLNTAQVSVVEIKSSLAADHSTKNDDIIASTSTAREMGEQQNDAISSPVKYPEVAKSRSPKLNSDHSIDKSLSKPMQRKTTAKKMLGSRPRLNMGNVANQKCSIYLSGASSRSNAMMHSVAEIGAADHDLSSDAGNPKDLPVYDAAIAVNLQTKDAQPGNKVNDNAASMDDDSEAPSEFENVESGLQCKPAVLSDVSGTAAKELSGAEQHGTDEAEAKALFVHKDAVALNIQEKPRQGASVETHSTNDEMTKAKKATSAKTKKQGHPASEAVKPKSCGDVEQVEGAKNGEQAGIDKKKRVPHPAGSAGKRGYPASEAVKPKTPVHGEQFEGVKKDKIAGAKKKKILHPAGSAGTKSHPASEVVMSKTPDDREQVKGVKYEKKAGIEKKRVLHPAGSVGNGTPLVSKSEGPEEVEKENEPVVDNYQNTSKGEKVVGKLTAKSTENKRKSDQKAVRTCDALQKRDVLSVLGKGPAWFIFSGHRLQRKDFRKVIRQLKGRLCRDSHQWSYQATHLIVPDPIRRTEKFFAAAASGRWILKTDYLTASNEAGRFLPEEPYEWHKNGLSEDGAINLEAPRKWRLLREKTGHGAFYGMSIIIYGECIAPPLDTLKRVVKAGHGTILATCPPYTRFLNSGVDFAIVSPGMPSVDMWVQEFLRHEIPCVLADYLVEYVCKPGYSRERHVQYNTHEWAAKSFANLLCRSEQIIEDSASSPDNQFTDDLTCQVCGCGDRGEVMLICGNESGSTGCGIGTHIDCCNPPLKEVPEEYWFCPKCTNTKTPPPGTK
ncbi:hypothetical protein Ancab_020325 [Ancistrocladus abbreviatus]